MLISKKNRREVYKYLFKGKALLPTWHASGRHAALDHMLPSTGS